VSGHRHNEVFVKIHDEGWAVSKPNAERASGVYDTQAEAIEREASARIRNTFRGKARSLRLRCAPSLTAFLAINSDLGPTSAGRRSFNCSNDINGLWIRTSKLDIVCI